MNRDTSFALRGVKCLESSAGARLSAVVWMGVGLAAVLLSASTAHAQAGWQSRDIGTSTAGSTTESGGTISISGSGWDIWDRSDGFRYYSREVIGDFDLVVRVASLGYTHGWAKAGIMARTGLEANATNALMCVSAAHGTVFQWRPNVGAFSEAATPSEDGTAPRWLKLSRREHIITGYSSFDGVTWTLARSYPLTFAPSVQLGLAVTSHNDGVLTTAQFDSLALTLAPPAPTDLRVTQRGHRRIDLAWTDNSTDETGFVIEITNPRRNEWRVVGNAGPNATAFSVTDLSEGAAYAFRVKAVGGNGVAGAHSTTVFTATTMTPRPVVTAVAVDAVNLQWDEMNSTLGVPPSVGPFSVERSRDNVTFTPIASGVMGTRISATESRTTYADRTVEPNTTYYYRVRFLDTNGDTSGYGMVGPVTTPSSPPSAPPTAPSNLVATALSFSHLRLTWNDNSTTETGFRIYRSDNTSPAMLRATVPANESRFDDTGLAPSTRYTYTVRAFNSAGESSASNSAEVTTPQSELWSSSDIGPVGVAGNTTRSGDTFTLTASGVDIWGTVDSGRFTAHPLTGNGEIVARVTPPSNTDAWAKAGLMTRTNYDGNRANVFVFLTPNGSIGLQHRSTDGGTTTLAAFRSGSGATWLKLARSGNTFTAYSSSDRVTWTTVGSVAVTMPDGIFAGLALTSHNNSTTTTAQFASTTLQSGATPPPSPAPQVASFTIESSRKDGSEFEATYRLVFSEPVTGVDAADFTVAHLGGKPALGINPWVESVTGSGSSYAIVVSAHYNNATGGQFRLDLKSSGSGIVDSDNTPLSSGATGPVYSTPGGPWPIYSVNPPPAGNYTTGQVLSFVVDYGNLRSMVVNGTPRLALTVGSATRYATFAGFFAESFDAVLLFHYTVQAGDLDTDGITMANSLDLNGGTIRGANGADGLLTFTPRDTSNVRVNSSTESAWQSGDIGPVAAAGRTTVNGGAITVTGSGADIWGSSDEFQFHSQALSGDGEIVGRVTGVDNTHAWAKAGLMMRATGEANAPNAFVFATPQMDVGYQHRSAQGGATTLASFVEAWPPLWLRLVRAGNTFTGYYSSNGTTWTNAGSVSITMGSSILVGLAVTSHSDGTLCNATFENVVIRGATTEPPPTPSIAAPSNLRGVAASATAIQIQWNDNSSNETNFEVERAADGATFIRIAVTAANQISHTDTAVAAGASYSYRVRAINASANSAYSNVLFASTPVDSGPWIADLIGNSGRSDVNWSANGSNVTVTASGEDIWGRADGFLLVHKPLNGDGQITARVGAFSGEHPWAKAGLMIRESTTPGSPHAFVYLTPVNGAGLHARTTAGGETSITAGPWWADAPYWLRLVRAGNVFSAYASADGATWSLIGTQTVAMTSAVHIGLAVSAHDVTQLATAEFTNVQLGGP